MLLSGLLIIGGVIFTFVNFLFLLSLFTKRNDMMDVAWGIGIILVAATSYVLNSANSINLNLILVLVSLWGVRLAVRIFLRNIKKSEDYRYKNWRDEWGRWFYLRSYFQVYLLQGLLMIVIGYSAIHASVYATATELSLPLVLGALVWSIGFMFEVVGDYQLDTFLKQPANQGKVIDTGLWRYTRHPNYFGEVTMWWGIWLIVATLPLGYIALVSPITITFLILKVSGIPMLEKKFAGNPAFESYKQKTSVFFPLPPKAN